ncbi:MAG: MgtC/SapB family protein [Anaerolineae bacterium]|jgi:putative Mg2+ transporter-C (MgtC) family protein
MLQFFSAYATQFEILAHVAVAMVLGAIIGLEREFKDKPAGLRTHMLVAGAAALLVSLGDVVTTQFHLDLGGQVVQADPIRIMEAVITGISFLGAGTIIRSRAGGHVEGLTTAASLLVAAGVGICAALWQIVLALGITVLVLITLRGLGFAEKQLGGKEEQQ